MIEYILLVGFAGIIFSLGVFLYKLRKLALMTDEEAIEEIEISQ